MTEEEYKPKPCTRSQAHDFWGFHVKDGWFFEGPGHGSPNRGVTIRKAKYGDNGYLVFEEITMDADSWASVVAAVSAKGTTGDRWERARRFHTE